jgi:hypothetical protein
MSVNEQTKLLQDVLIYETHPALDLLAELRRQKKNQSLVGTLPSFR